MTIVNIQSQLPGCLNHTLGKITVDFSDNVGTTPSAHFDSLLASQGTYPTGSFCDFYLENISNSSDTMTADIYVRPVAIEEEMSTEKNLSPFQVSPSIGTKNFTISFFQPDGNDNITVKILDVSGRIVKKYNEINKGSTTWNGNDNIGKRVSPGVYFVYVEYMGSNGAKNAVEVKQIIVLD